MDVEREPPLSVSAAATADHSEGSTETKPCIIKTHEGASIDRPEPEVAPSLPTSDSISQGTQRASIWRSRLIRAAGLFCKVVITLQVLATAYDLLPSGGKNQRYGQQQAGGSNKQSSRRSTASSGSHAGGSNGIRKQTDGSIDQDELVSTIGRVVMFLSGDGQQGADELQHISTSKLQTALEMIDTEVLDVMQVEDAQQMKQDIAVMLKQMRQAKRSITAEDGHQDLAPIGADRMVSSSPLDGSTMQ